MVVEAGHGLVIGVFSDLVEFCFGQSFNVGLLDRYRCNVPVLFRYFLSSRRSSVGEMSEVTEAFDEFHMICEPGPVIIGNSFPQVLVE